MLRKTTLLAARRAHNFKYLYLYDQCDEQSLQILCPFHGRFSRPTVAHIHRALGCPKCEAGHTITYEEFEALYAPHITQDLKVIRPTTFRPTGYIGVQCRFHPERKTMLVSALLNGKRCPDCATGIRSRKEYIREARLKHRRKYTYDAIKQGYVNGDILVACEAHGQFRVNALAHLGGTGCRSCKYANEKSFYIYLFLIYKGNRKVFKTGLSNNIERREKELRRGVAKGYEIKLLGFKKFKQEYGSFKTEFFFLDNFCSIGKQLTNKTVLKDGYTEAFASTKTVARVKEVFDSIDRKYRRIYKTYVPKRQLWNAHKRATRKRVRHTYKRHS